MNVCILGSTGSIGTQAIEVAKNLNLNIIAISGHKNIELLEKQIAEVQPKYVVVTDDKSYKYLKNKKNNYKILYGMEGLLEIVSLQEVDIVLNSLVGNIGLKPTVHGIKNSKNIALANKETLVTAGEFIMPLVKEKNVKLLPVDSEHSAIFQCLQGNEQNKIERIHLTASGGPFRNLAKEELENVTVEQALKHPNWSMGAKITIDSASLMNKGLEVIEAKHLFDLDVSNINVVVHPESIIHSMVEYEDSSIIAQLGEPDMKVPIQYAFTYPNRVRNNFKRLNFLEIGSLTFEKASMEKFPCLKLAFQAIEEGGLVPTVLNAANEVAVAKFLAKEIAFTDIPKYIYNKINEFKKYNYNFTLENIFVVDEWARK
ncbi:MAG: 1-deoxy-D-xylulose-5-phosphate reductoisomerase [Lachnospirales bacterium]